MSDQNNLPEIEIAPQIEDVENELENENGNDEEEFVMAEALKSKCPVFDGSEEEAKVSQFIHEVNTWSKQFNLADDKIAAHVSMAFTGIAKEWSWIEQRKGNKDHEKWTTLAECLKKRFSILKVVAIKDLKHKKEESLATFFQRCDAHVFLKNQSLPDDEKKSNAFKILVNKEILDIFVKGIPPRIQNRVIANGDHICADQKDYATFDMKKFLDKVLTYDSADVYTGLAKSYANAAAGGADGGAKVKKEKMDSVSKEMDINEMSMEEMKKEIMKTRKSSRLQSITCFHCGFSGHYGSSCPKKDEPQSQAGMDAQAAVAARRGRGGGRGGRGRGRGRGGNTTDGTTTPGAAATAAPAVSAISTSAGPGMDKAAMKAMLKDIAQEMYNVSDKPAKMSIFETKTPIENFFSNIQDMYNASDNAAELCINSPFANDFKSKTSIYNFLKPATSAISTIFAFSTILSCLVTGRGTSLDLPSTVARPTVSIRMNESLNVGHLTDSGASLTAIRQDIFEQIPNHQNLKTTKIPSSLKITGANGSRIRARKIAMIPVEILGHKRVLPYAIVPELNSNAILGWDSVRAMGGIIDSTTNSLILPDSNGVIKLQKPSGNTRTWKEAKISSMKECKIPAFYRKRLDINMLDMNGSKIIGDGNFEFQPIEKFRNVIEDGLYREKQFIFVQNYSPNEMIIRENELIGNAIIIDETYQVDELVINDEPLNKLDLKECPPLKAAFIDKTAKIEAPEEYRKKYLALLKKYHQCVSLSKFDLGYMKRFRHRIKLNDDTPSHVKQFPIPIKLRPVVDDYVNGLKKAGVVKDSTSPWNSPLFLIRKKSDPSSYRVLQDCRQVNSQSVLDKYFFKNFMDTWAEVAEAKSKVFTGIDLVSSYWQMPLTEDSTHITAFSLPGQGRFEWTSAVQGLHGSPSSFGRAMEKILQKIVGVSTFLDDILLHHRTHDDHLEKLEETLKRLVAFNLKVNLGKCSFGASNVAYVGMEINGSGILPGEDNTKAIRDFQEPTTPKQIKSFCGLANFFGPYIPSFAKWNDRLMRLTRRDSTWKGGALPPSAKTAFEQLKKILGDRPLMVHPNFEKTFYLVTDACLPSEKEGTSGGLGAMLAQKDNLGNLRPISYASRTLRGSERNYSPFMAESLAACWAMTKFRTFLLGRKFILQTDHKPIVKATWKQQQTLSRLQQLMNEYEFTTEYRPGPENSVADCLSRNTISAVAVLTGSANLVELQNADDDIVAVKKFLERRNEEDLRADLQKFSNQCMIEDGVVWIIDKSFNPEKPRKLFWPPRKSCGSLIHQYHASDLMAHRGIVATKLRMNAKFRWPRMNEDIENFINSCDLCQRMKTNPHRSKAPLIPFERCTAPNQRVSMDLFTNVPGPNQKKMNLLCIMDDFSKYVEITVIPNKEAKTVAEAFFTTWICRHSVPCRVRFDAGTEFKNRFMSHLTERLGIDKCPITVLNPESNGGIERFNQHLVAFFQRLEKFDPEIWPSKIECMRMAYNCSINRATKFTPFYLTHGRCPKLGAFDPTQTDEDQLEKCQSKDEEARNYVQLLFDRFKKDFVVAKDNLDLHAKLMTEQEAKRKNNTVFRTGDSVLLYYPKIVMKGPFIKSNKNWVGPYTIVERKGLLTYEIACPGKRNQVVHCNRLKLYRFGEHEWAKEVSDPMEHALKEIEDEMTALLSGETGPKDQVEMKRKDDVKEKEVKMKKHETMKKLVSRPSQKKIEDALIDEECEESEDLPDLSNQTNEGEEVDEDGNLPDSILPDYSDLVGQETDDEEMPTARSFSDVENCVEMPTFRTSPVQTRQRGNVVEREWVQPRPIEYKRKRPDFDETVASDPPTKERRTDLESVFIKNNKNIAVKNFFHRLALWNASKSFLC